MIAGVLFGLQAYKPHLALMIPVALLAGRQWRAFVAAGVTVGVLLLASLALAGWDSWRGFLDLTPLLRKITLEDADAVWHRNVSVFMAVSRLGVGLSGRLCGADRRRRCSRPHWSPMRGSRMHPRPRATPP